MNLEINPNARCASQVCQERAQKRTNVGGIWPDGCEVPPLLAPKNKMTRCAAREQGRWPQDRGPLAADIGVLSTRFERLPLGPPGEIRLIERKMPPTHDAPYRGLRVLDFGQGIASPYCAMLLGVYGAEVTKVEPPRETGRAIWGRLTGVIRRCLPSIIAASAVCASI